MVPVPHEALLMRQGYEPVVKVAHVGVMGPSLDTSSFSVAYMAMGKRRKRRQRRCGPSSMRRSLKRAFTTGP
jgi:hypothetical protein